MNRNISVISVAFGVAARKFELTKTSRESLLAAYDCWLARPTSIYTTRSVPQFRGPWLHVGSCSCPLVKFIRSVGGRFLSRSVYPKF